MSFHEMASLVASRRGFRLQSASFALLEKMSWRVGGWTKMALMARHFIPDSLLE